MALSVNLIVLLFLYLAWAIICQRFFHQVFSATLLSLVLLAFSIYHQPISIWTLLAVPVTVFCVTLLPPVQRFRNGFNASGPQDRVALEVFLPKPNESECDEDSKCPYYAESVQSLTSNQLKSHTNCALSCL
jgi:hypothetical protein